MTTDWCTYKSQHSRQVNLAIVQSVRRRLRLEVSTLSSGKPPVCTPFQVQ